jgi:ABC-type glycerol-3-phosphate transport system substrate-binding protein
MLQVAIDNGESMKKTSRRRFLCWFRDLGVVAFFAPALGGCRERIVEVEKTVEVPREVTRVVREIVRETVIVERTPKKPTLAAPSTTPSVRRTETAISAPKVRVQVVADVLSYGWTELGVQMTPTFEEMFPHIGITWRSLSDWQGYSRHIAALYAADQLGDLIEAPLGVLPIHWAQKKLIRPLDELMSADGFEYRSIFSGAMDACLYEGQYVALPFVCHGGENLVLYNRDLLRRAGVAEPTLDWTLDDLQEATQALTEKLDNRQVEQFGHAVSYEMPGSYPMLRLFDAHLFSEDGRKSALDGPNTVACLDWAQDQVLVQHTAPSPAEIERSTLDMFLQGRVAMLRHSLRTLMQVSAADGPLPTVQGTLFPRHPATGKIAAYISGMAYAITTKSKVPAEVFQWVKFMSSREMGVQMFLGGYAEPGCRMASWKDPRVVELLPLCSPLADAMVVGKPARLPWNLRVAACMNAWNEWLGPLWRNELKPERISQQMAKAINSILRQPVEDLVTDQDLVGTSTRL